MAKTGKALSGPGFLAALIFVGQVQATSTIKIDVDTLGLGLSGTIWQLAFDFNSFSSTPNSVTISDFDITGGLPDSGLIGSSIPGFGDVEGDLSTTVTLRNPITTCCSEYLHDAKLGDGLTFIFAITGNLDPTTEPPAFSFFLLDETGATFPTGDPSGALFVYTIGNEDQPSLYPPQDCPDCVRKEQLPAANGVPEPGALALAMAGLLALGIFVSVTNHPLRRKLAA